ncbi:MAG: metallopeptidase TldD-related protein [Candidatus Acidiferrales bacterium]
MSGNMLRGAAGFLLCVLAIASAPAAIFAAPAGDDNDQTLRAMRDEMARSKARLKTAEGQKPFFIEYRLLDLDVRSVTGSFGALLTSTTTRNRFMSVGVRFGDYHFDSSNFIADQSFQGFLGSTGQVGIDRDYSSLRQDLWLATDQAFKEAYEQMGRKQAFLRSLAKPPEIDDFSQEQSVQLVEPRLEPDWTSRNWDDEARKTSSALRKFSNLFGSRVNYSLIYATEYLLTSEGTEIRSSRSIAAIEATLDTQADDGMPLHNFYSVYVARPADLPDAETVGHALEKTSQELEALRAAPLVPDYVGPVLFDAQAAGPLIAQTLEPSLSGARGPLSMVPFFDQLMERVGGRSEWSGRMATRVLPADVTLVDDPAAKEFQGHSLLGGYEADEEGVRGQRVELVTNGTLHDLLMSRRPGPEFDHSNGHGRSALLADAHPASSSLFFQVSDGMNPADLRHKFLDLCKADGHPWCLEVKRMDNPALAALRGEDFQELIAAFAEGVATGDRIPLLVYRMYVDDGHEELVRGGRLTGITLRSLRNIAGMGSDATATNFMLNPSAGFAGTALATFGNAQGGIPASIVAPSVLLEDVEMRGYHGEPRRTPLLPLPPLQ